MYIDIEVKIKKNRKNLKVLTVDFYQLNFCTHPYLCLGDHLVRLMCARATKLAGHETALPSPGLPVWVSVKDNPYLYL